ncbi:MAG TPA: amino acid adenylation domain-containing protein [Aldersonia sp.]
MSGGCLHTVIEARADERPGAIAIESDGRLISYRQLDAAANQLAAALRGAGASRDRLVALYGRVCPELLLAMLAVLKAGAAFLPLDPSDPRSRTRALLEQARPVVLLTTFDWHAQADGLADEAMIVHPGSFHQSAVRLQTDCRPSDLAYALFTSGSTGRPKGVLVEHGSIVNYCAWVARANRVDGRVAPLPTVTRFTADAAMQQLVAPLTRGDPVWMIPEDARGVPERLLALLRGRPGAGLHCVPALWEEVLIQLESDGESALELSSLFLGGEAVRPELWERTRRVLPHTAMANVYGPTEATVQATGGFQPRGEPLHTGRPVDNVTVHVFGGEVWIGGAGVARGYLGDPELTAQRFRDGAEFGLESGRIYRTGDAGVLLGGALRVVGRLDDQVKVRGFRIEPAEIEDVLIDHPGVRSAAVVVPAAGPHAGSLCAAVVADASVLPELRAAVSDRLPAHMLPAQWRFVATLPLTATGKVDRRRLADDFATQPDAAPGRPLRTAAEHAVASVWAEVLGREVNSADADFFELGGNSLNANRVAARLRRKLGATNALAALFERRTVGAVAAALTLDGPVAPPKQMLPEVDFAPLSLQQEAIWATERILAGLPFNNVVFPILISGPLDVAMLRRALCGVLAAQPALRTRFEIVDGAPRQRVGSTHTVEVTEVDLRDADGRESAALDHARSFFARPFDLAGGLLLRAMLLRLADAQRVLLLGTHHIVCDGVSLQVILDQLVDAYRDPASVGDGPGPRYLDYAWAQRQELRNGRLVAGLEYWQRKLAHPVTEVPSLGGSGRSADRFRFGVTTAAMGEAPTERLRSYARRRGVTPFICLSATLAVLLQRRGAAAPIRLATLAANREDDEFASVVGLFATTVVLHLAPTPEMTYDDLVEAAKVELVETSMHQRIPLELALDAGASPPQVGLALEPGRRPRTVGATRFEVYSSDSQEISLPVAPSSMDVSITIAERGPDMLGRIEYRDSALDRTAATGLLTELFALLDRQLAAPERALGECAAVDGPTRRLHVGSR